MPTYRLTLEYDGTGYSGWQRQPERATVEGALRTAIAAVSSPVEAMTAAGRTDAGAHSHGQVVGVRLAREWDPASLAAAINAMLPEDIVVVGAAVVDDSFHARYDAVERTYRYVVAPRRQRMPLTRHYAWQVVGELDLDAMRCAADRLCGNHDFAAFGRSPREGGTTRRTVSGVRVRQVQNYDGYWPEPPAALVIDVSANAFLYGMMRTIVGALVAVGRGRLTPDGISLMLQHPQASHRHVAVAPAHGLHQWTVTYA